MSSIRSRSKEQTPESLDQPSWPSAHQSLGCARQWGQEGHVLEGLGNITVVMTQRNDTKEVVFENQTVSEKNNPRKYLCSVEDGENFAVAGHCREKGEEAPGVNKSCWNE